MRARAVQEMLALLDKAGMADEIESWGPINPVKGAAMPASIRHCVAFVLGMATCGVALAQVDRPPALLPLASEPAARLVVYSPLPDALARGVVIVQFRVENFRIMPVFGAQAVGVSPRLGHLHVTVDNWQGTWAHTSGDPVIIVGLTPGGAQDTAGAGRSGPQDPGQRDGERHRARYQGRPAARPLKTLRPAAWRCGYSRFS